MKNEVELVEILNSIENVDKLVSVDVLSKIGELTLSETLKIEHALDYDKFKYFRWLHLKSKTYVTYQHSDVIFSLELFPISIFSDNDFDKEPITLATDLTKKTCQTITDSYAEHGIVAKAIPKLLPLSVTERDDFTCIYSDIINIFATSANEQSPSSETKTRLGRILMDILESNDESIELHSNVVNKYLIPCIVMTKKGCNAYLEPLTIKDTLAIGQSVGAEYSTIISNTKCVVMPSQAHGFGDISALVLEISAFASRFKNMSSLSLSASKPDSEGKIEVTTRLSSDGQILTFAQDGNTHNIVELQMAMNITAPSFLETKGILIDVSNVLCKLLPDIAISIKE
ncbi:hypothetical protein [Photobacterium kishitanii]|uniref:Uncharacterized protein n=1 Tax=Photobacterium kishitanii TaxID=318456 RepID=A0A2T3KN39_9GAMM|nr:hypothetical protein [Photobacterium kishitanii]PSV01155.1 hypothetical protein C9J27_03790 [Photobacterium kishitanii]